jgi:hypothetical protein
MPVRHAWLLCLPLAACAPKAGPAVPQHVVFTATEFSFTGPDSIAPGVTTIRLVNAGQQDHHLILGQLAPGKTMADLVAFAQANADAEPPFLKWRGGANGVAHGDSTGSTTDLPAGNYVLICFLPDPTDGKPHIVKGMMRPLTVAGPRHEAPVPVAMGEIRLKDFTFVTPPLTAGTHTFRIVNDGPQTHEVQLVRLAEGVTGQQFMAAMAPGSTTPPPGVMVGGPGALSSGLEDFWTVTITPGTYLMVCFVPDTATGAPHVAKGMVHEFTVPAS